MCVHLDELPALENVTQSADLGTFGKMKCSIRLPTSSPSLLYLQVTVWTWKRKKILLYILFNFVDVNLKVF